MRSNRRGEKLTAFGKKRVTSRKSLLVRLETSSKYHFIYTLTSVTYYYLTAHCTAWYLVCRSIAWTRMFSQCVFSNDICASICRAESSVIVLSANSWEPACRIWPIRFCSTISRTMNSWKREYKYSMESNLSTHTHTCLTALCPGLPGWASTRKVKSIWILLKRQWMAVASATYRMLFFFATWKLFYLVLLAKTAH